MRAREIVKHVERARLMAQKEIEGVAQLGGRFAGGLSSEGYHGGYRDALDDVILLLNGVVPNRYPYWRR